MRFKLSSEMTAIEALSHILLRLVRVMETNRRGVITDTSPESLHDFRVAVRRTRALLAQCKASFPPSMLDHYRSEFRWLGSATSRTRDLDVFLLNFPDFRRSLPKKLRPHLRALRSHIREKREQAQEQTVEVLQSGRYRRLISSWVVWLTQATFESNLPEQAGRPVTELASQQIWSAYQSVLLDGNTIIPASPVTDLHALRKECKKLRYLMELFRDLYPKKEIRSLISHLRALQNILGTVQDCHVQTEALRTFSGEMMSQIKSVPSGTMKAVDVLIEELRSREEQSRSSFESAFKKFKKPKWQKRFTALFQKTHSS